MKVFQLTWSWYEECSFWLFFHKEDKTKEDWESDCKKAIKNIGKEYLDQETSWPGASRWIEMSTIELEKLGYKKIKPIEFGCFGSYIIDERKNEDKDEFEKIVGKELIDRAVGMSKKIQKTLYSKKKG